MADFTLDAYRELVSAFLHRGYQAVDYATVPVASPGLILRHDVDMSLAAAVDVAQVEAELGVSATYFILLRSRLYNPFAEVERIERLLSLGHSVELHLDASLYSPDDLEGGAERELSLLRSVTQREPRIISFHRPAKVWLNNPATIAGLPHTYQPEWFDRMAYVSDSRGGWNHGHPFSHPAFGARAPIQLLTHPIWWHRTEAEPVVDRLDRLLLDMVVDDRTVLEDNCGSYRPTVLPWENKSL